MRKQWIVTCILSASVVGCASGGFPGSKQQFAGHPQTEQLMASQSAGQPQQTWTQKVTGVFTGNSNKPIGPGSPSGNSAVDPISLGFASGPPNADLYLSMAKMSDQSGNSAHARSMYHRALTIQPNHLEGMLALARMEDREGQLDAALHYYKQAVHYHQNSAKAHNDLSLCYARRGQVAEALPPLEQAIRLEPNKQLYRNNIAKVLIEMNQLDGAMQHLAVAHPPAVAQYNMGVLLHERNRDQEAAGYLMAAAQADPTLQAASTLLAELSGNGAQVAQGSPSQTSGVVPAQANRPYQTPGPIGVSREFQTVPAEMARRPVGYSPGMTAPVR